MEACDMAESLTLPNKGAATAVARFNICIARPQGYVHSECFCEIAEGLQAGLVRLGFPSTTVGWNAVLPDAVNIVLGIHLAGEATAMSLPPQTTVVYNLEQLGAAWLPPWYIALGRRYQVWDYSPVNLRMWQEAAGLFGSHVSPRHGAPKSVLSHVSAMNAAPAIPEGAPRLASETWVSGRLGSAETPSHISPRPFDGLRASYGAPTVLQAPWKVRLVEVGYVPELTRIVRRAMQTVDVFFYGSMNDRRRDLLMRLKDAGMEVRYGFGLYRADRDAKIADAKIVLNLHARDDAPFEVVRVSYLLANRKAVVSEASADIGSLADAVALATPENIVDVCRDLLVDDAKRHALEQRGFEVFSRHSMLPGLQAAIAAYV